MAYMRSPGWAPSASVPFFEPIKIQVADADVERQAQAAELGPKLQQKRFEQLFPWLQKQWQGAQTGGDPYTIGGQGPPSPEITVGPIWNDQQTQQRVNAERASSDRSTATQMRGMQESLGGRGVGSSSPLAMALGGQMQAANIGRKAGGEREIRNNAAQENAGHIFQTQMGRESQFASRQNEAIERAKPYFAERNLLLSALAGMI